MYKRILVPLDGSERAETILPHVEDLASKHDESQVVLLQVLEPPPEIYMAGSPLVDQETIDRIVGDTRKYLETVQKRLREKGIESHVHVRVGPIVGTIIDLAQQEKVDLIAIASHGRTGLPAVFYGSVAVGVLHRAESSLLIIRSIQKRANNTMAKREI
jgi:nucleotide-binding universal stress UspA family protein